MTHDVIPDFIGGGNHDYNEGEVHESKKSDSVGGRSSDLTDGHSFRLRYGLNRWFVYFLLESQMVPFDNFNVKS